jgi:putative DNA primase/helicase
MTDRIDPLAYAAEIARLAALPQVEYDRERRDAAARLGIRTATLDAEIANVKGSNRQSREPDPECDDCLPPGFTDEALALEFSDQHEDRLRYVAAWGKWMEWDGTCWQSDKTLRAFDLARVICRRASAECNDRRLAAAIASAKTVAAVERLAKADRRHAATVEQWDCDTWLLNTPDGIVDLRDGAMHPHRPDRHITKITAVAPGGDITQWMKFLNRITDGNLELRAYLQRVAGYCLTGSTKEHALFFGYGTGANGKGTFLNTLTAIMGGYATIAPMETFTASAHERHPTDLAMLRGARLVSAQETEEGRRLAEAKVKAMTGGDPITARFMKQDFFTFTPTFKLFIAGNHKPGLRNVDEAIRRRFNLIPFEVRIPAEERDPDLAQKLQAEWPGILQWMIDGCLAWQRDGLKAPAIVTDATNEYFEAEDAMATWLAERTISGKGWEYSSSDLFRSWRDWAEAAGEQAGSQKRFTQAMNARGFPSVRQPNGRAALSGIGLLPNAPYSEAA